MINNLMCICYEISWHEWTLALLHLLQSTQPKQTKHTLTHTYYQCEIFGQSHIYSEVNKHSSGNHTGQPPWRWKGDLTDRRKNVDSRCISLGGWDLLHHLAMEQIMPIVQDAQKKLVNSRSMGLETLTADSEVTSDSKQTQSRERQLHRSPKTVL